MTAVLRTEMASNRERCEKKPFICCLWKNSLSSLDRVTDGCPCGATDRHLL
jgi:hypothetical protein